MSKSLKSTYKGTVLAIWSEVYLGDRWKYLCCSTQAIRGRSAWSFNHTLDSLDTAFWLWSLLDSWSKTDCSWWTILSIFYQSRPRRRRSRARHWQIYLGWIKLPTSFLYFCWLFNPYFTRRLYRTFLKNCYLSYQPSKTCQHLYEGV